MSEEDKQTQEERLLKVTQEESDSRVTSPTFQRPVSPSIAAAYDKAFKKVAEAASHVLTPAAAGSSSKTSRPLLQEPTSVSVFGSEEVEQELAARLARVENLRKEKEKKSNSNKPKMSGDGKAKKVKEESKMGGDGERETSKVVKTYEDNPELFSLSFQSRTSIDHIEKELKLAEVCLQTSPPDLASAEAAIVVLENDLEEFQEVQKEFLGKLLENKMTVDYTEEMPIHSKLLKELTRLKIILMKLTPAGSGVPLNYDGRQPNVSYQIQEKIKYDMPKFDGEVRNWLSWWAAYKEFHEDKSYSPTRKFQVLLQAMVPGTRAHRCVASLPASEENYEKAVDQLKSEFGDEKMLIKVYVRDLMKLVQENSKDKPSLSFPDMVTSLKSQLLNLKSLGLDLDEHGIILYPVMESCVPARVLESYLGIPDCKQELQDFMDFLDSEVRKKMQSNLARVDKKEKEPEGNGKKTNGKSKASSTTASFLNTADDKRCVFCSKSRHVAADCHKAVDMTLEERKEALNKVSACFKCFKPGHLSNACRAKVKCMKCSGRHHTLMCFGEESGSTTPAAATPIGSGSDGGASPAQSAQTPGGSANTSTAMMALAEKPDVQLQTLFIKVRGRGGQSKLTRAVYDSCCQGSYVKESLAKDLKLTKIGSERVSHVTFGGHVGQQQVHPRYKLLVSSPEREHYKEIGVSGVKQITGDLRSIPMGPWIEECWERGIKLSDVGEGASQVEVLLGADVSPQLLLGRQSVQLSSGPVAVETQLGWVLWGELPKKTYHQSLSMLNLDLHCRLEDLSNLWSLENLGIWDQSTTQSKEELAMEAQQMFEKTIKRSESGRYQVCLPFLAGTSSTLSSNYYGSERRLLSMTKKLKLEGNWKLYDDVLCQWEKDQMIEEVSLEKDVGHYLPHRAVIKLSSATTPIRPVFDASARAKGSPSLNMCLEKGPNYLELIPDLLTKFRMDKVGVTADIKKAFQQIEVAPEHRDYLRFLWWEDERCEKIKVFRHTRVVFGVSSSPFLLAATLKFHLEKSPPHLKEVADKLLESLYVDNVVVSLPSFKDAEVFQLGAKELLDPAYFDLRGWEFGPKPEGGIINILGLNWDTKEDVFSVELGPVGDKLGKGTCQKAVLSTVHSIFDPLGLASPFTILGKGIMRQCHDAKLGWEKPLPPEIQENFNKWTLQIPDLQQLKVPRYCHWTAGENRSLHVFCDASAMAYATAVYVRVKTKESITVSLLSAKAKLAPKDKKKTPTSIPRLELLGCLIGSRLAREELKKLGNPSVPVVFWTDSTTALAWIKGEGPWAVFVQNRVLEIRSLTADHQWRHIPGKENPADLPSRGCSAAKLVESKWWNGPEWLYKEEKYWPATVGAIDDDEVSQERKKTVVAHLNVDSNQPLDKFLTISDYPRMIKAVAWWNRYCNNVYFRVCKKKEPIPEIPSPPDLQTCELEEAEKILLRHSQRTLREDPGRLFQVKAFSDKDGILRTKTRIFADDEISVAPIILDDKDVIAQRILRHIHSDTCHVGTQLLLGKVREKFWLLNGRRACKKIVNACWICRHFNQRKLQVEEPPLPLPRTGTGAPFSCIGVDMAGPLKLRDNSKVWIAFFTCASYRAIHMEIVEKMSTTAFLEAFRKFVLRRGKPSLVYSDNGLNFIGADAALRRIYKKNISQFAADQKISWRFNPPSAPWYGGWWERLIGLMKKLVRRNLRNKVVHRAELETVLLEVQEAANNRPLTYLGEKPDDPIPLTPNMFIRDSGLAHFPELDIRDAASARAAHRRILELRKKLRSRFKREYLGQLKYERNRKGSLTTLQYGDVVLIGQDTEKRQSWPLGVVVEAISGGDGIVRKYRLKTKTGFIIRPAQRLYPMELGEGDISQHQG